MENDGTFRCKPCRQALNETDVNCWRCGSKDIEDLRPKPYVEELVVADQAGVEEVLRGWAIQNYNNSGTSTTASSSAPIWFGEAVVGVGQSVPWVVTT